MDSPFKDILYTNTQIHELLEEPRKEAAALSAEIERLRALIHQLIQKRDNLEGFIHAHEALVSPVRRLPADIMAEIFAACMPPDRNAIMSAAEAPLLLCRVCRAWRDVALSTPRLWASLHTVAHGNIRADGPDSKLQKVVKAIDSWLSRSGVLPLSISLVRSWTSKEVDFHPFLETLIRYSSRWRRIRFELEPSSSFEPLGALSPSDVPMLEIVSMDGFQTSNEEADGRAVSFLGTASLRSLFFRHMATSFFTFPLPWNQLRHLSFEDEINPPGLAVAQALEMLRQCSNLETCFLILTGLGRYSVLGISFNPLMYLRRGGSTAHFLKYLDVPNLKSLEYAAEDVADFSFTSLLASLKCLECLRLRIEDEHDIESIVGCLRLVPTLQELTICYDTALGEDFWTSMTPTADNQDTIARNGSQSQDIARLSKVHVQFNRRREIDIVSALRPDVAEGLDFSLNYGYVPSEDNEVHTIDGEVLSQWWSNDDQ
ncbi:hypothetical protein MSAN_00028000 [Mycena sanguinolenta]|uniref:F-box domain-containing protein n=1 Tax=Mycena sanguinolenta TaxID=230812 RepID=A0A8H6ZH10_9AGAR|nr:hypothetical protein MSAN_00028000 [Mycena sanguinolenta]